MDVSKLDLSKYMNVLSTRHHYLPQFLLQGFANSDGLLFINNKKQDKILKSARPPKSIFFESGIVYYDWLNLFFYAKLISF